MITNTRKSPIDVIFEAAQLTNKLTRLGIKIQDNGFPMLYDGIESYAYQDMIAGLQEDQLFFTGPTPQNILTLALAIHQEDQNDYIEDEKIAFVNNVFEDYLKSPITYEDVQKYNSRYI